MRYSFKRHSSSDYFVVLSIIFPIVFWFILFYDIVTSAQDINSSDILITINSMITVFAALIIFIRIRKMKELCIIGKSVKGYVYKIDRNRDRGQMLCVYKYNDVEYKKRFAFHRTKNSRQINVNDDIVLILDPNNPKNSYIRSFIDKDFNHGD